MSLRRESPNCPLCEIPSLSEIFIKAGRHFWRCRRCRLELIYPRPSPEELRTYYDASYREGMYRAFADAGGMKAATALLRYRMVSPHVRPGTWLDVGCANGFFVDCAARHGVRSDGIDISPAAVHEGKARGLSLHASDLADWRPGYLYDTITCFDVLEHVLDPVGFLGRVRDLLGPSGTLAITVPDLSSLIRSVMGPRWYFYIPEEHLHYFHPRTLGKLLGKTGFSMKRCSSAYKPLTFDYSLLQFQEYNPLLYKILSVLRRVVPTRLASMVVPLPIGEMAVIAEKVSAGGTNRSEERAPSSGSGKPLG